MSMSEANALMLQATAELEAQSPKPGTDKGDPTRRATSTFPSLSGHPSPTGRSSMLPEITQLNIHEPSSPISPLNNTRCIPVGDAQKEAVEVTEREVEIGPENTLNENGAVMQKLNSNYTTTEEERIRPERRYRRMHISLRTGFRWSYLIMAVIIIALLVIIIALSVEISKPNENHGTSTTSDTVLVIQDFSPGDAPPLVDSPVDTVDVIFGTYYGLASNRPQQKVVYNSAGGKICIRTKLGGAWLGSVRCILNANPKNNTPLTILDWAAGPSIYYITTDNKLSGVDNVPANDTWVLSSIAKQNVAVHPQSQINSLTWLNGSSTWVGYQDITGQVREFGLDDYRDQNLWRQSSGGSLGIAINGSFLSATRYSIGPNEFEEAGFQVDSNIIHLKRYANGAWGTEEYAVDGTISGFAAGAAFSITNIVNPTSTGESTILIAFMTTDGYITIQTRGTVNITDFSAFSKAVKIAQNDGNADAGLAVDGSSGTPKLVVMDKQSILEYTSDAAATNWTAPTTITT